MEEDATINAPRADAWQRAARPYLHGPPIPGPTAARRGVRNITLTSLAGRLRWEGHALDIIEPVLLAVNQRRCVPPEDARQVRRIAWWASKKPRGRARTAVPRAVYDTATEHIGALLELHQQTIFAGRGGNTERAVVAALLAIAWECGRATFTASERQLALRAGVGRIAVHRALHSPAVVRWVRRLEPGRATVRSEHDDGCATLKGSCWKVRTVAAVLRALGVRLNDTNKARYIRDGDPSPHKEIVGRRSENFATPALLMVSDRRADDLWRHGSAGGLGKSAERVYQALSARPWTSARALALALGMGATTVRRALAKLEAHGLAEFDAGASVLHWWCGPQTPDTVRPTLRSYGAADRQQHEHDHDREQFVDALARWRPGAGRRPLRLSPVPGIQIAAQPPPKRTEAAPGPMPWPRRPQSPAGRPRLPSTAAPPSVLRAPPPPPVHTAALFKAKR